MVIVVVTFPMELVANAFASYLVFIFLAAILFRYGFLGLAGVMVIDTDEMIIQRRSFFHTITVLMPQIIFFQPRLRTVKYRPVYSARGMGDNPITTHRSWCWHLDDIELELNTANVELLKSINTVLQDIVELQYTPLHHVEEQAPEVRQFPGLSRKLIVLPILPLFFIFSRQSQGSIQQQFIQIIQNELTNVFVVLFQLYLVFFGLFAMYLGVSIIYLMPVSSQDLEVSYRVTKNLMALVGYALISLALIMTAVFLNILHTGLINYVPQATGVVSVVAFLDAFFASATFILIPVMIVAFFVGIWWSGVLQDRNSQLEEMAKDPSVAYGSQD